MEPIQIVLCGCSGHMGHVVADCVRTRNDAQICAGIDLTDTVGGAFPVFQKPEDVTCHADVLIDFSHPSVLTSLLAYAVKHRVPAVLCSTGYSEAQLAQIRQASQEIPIFKSGNMSLGVNLLIELAKRAASVLGEPFDIEIIEKHHNRKLDAPSGTALMIADGGSEVLPDPMTYTYDRHSRRMPRSKSEIGIHSVRGGTIVGEHEILFAGPQETISITHTAQSREIFALGAVNAAAFMAGKQEPGLYDMTDLLKSTQ